MVEILSLLLGLVVGPVEVELGVDASVARVVLELNGAAAAEVSASPWQAEVDLGTALRPQRLVAVAFDADGREVGRDTRLLNVFRPPAEVTYALHRNQKGWVTSFSLSWPEIAGASARRWAVSVDGRPVDAEDPKQIYPPGLDPLQLRVIEAVAEYTNGLVTRDLIGVGGELGASSARLTAMPIDVPAGGPKPESMRARVVGSGDSVRVIASPRADLEIVFVRDAAALRAVERLAPARPDAGGLAGGRDAQAARVIHSVPIRRDEWIRVLHPGAPPAGGDGLGLHRVDVPLVSDDEGRFGLFWHLRDRSAMELGPSGRWLSDAVAIAGARVGFGDRRRAAVLLLAPDSRDEGSVLDTTIAREYLESLGVPLHVWYLGRPAKAPQTWGEVIGVRSVAGMETALDSLRIALGGQRIVWVEGVHLPGEVEIGPPGGS